MQLKKVGAVLAGAALLGATFAGAAAGAEPDVPDRDFFIDETTGLNNCLIVVGSGAAAADVVSASYVAAEIGTMAYTEETTENWLKPGVLYTPVADSTTANPYDGWFEENVDNYMPDIGPDDMDGEYDLYFDDFRDGFNYTPYFQGLTTWDYTDKESFGPESWVVLPYTCWGEYVLISELEVCNDTYEPIDWYDGTGTASDPDEYLPLELGLYEWWDYDLFVSPWTAMSSDLDYTSATDDDGNFLVNTGCSYEAITVDFSLRDLECSAEFCTACLAACDQHGFFEFTFYEGTTPVLGDLGGETTGFVNVITYDALLLECQSYPNVYPRHYWGTPEVYQNAQMDVLDYACSDNYLGTANPDEWSNPLTYCDPVGGVQYRAIADGFDSGVDTISWCSVIVPADADDRKETGDAFDAKTTPPSEAYLVCNESAPQCIDLYCDPCDIFFLGESYDALTFGTDYYGYDFMFYGTPEWYVEEKLAVGESKEYNGWDLTINDLGIYENKAYVTITNPDGVSYDYMVVIDQYTSQSPSPGDGDAEACSVSESIDARSNSSPYSEVTSCCDTSGDNEENDTIAFVQRVFDAYDLCGENEYGVIDYGWTEISNGVCDCETSSWYPKGEVVFAVKFVKTMIGAAGTYVVEYHAYDLADYGVLKEQVYTGPCETPIDPAISVNGLDWYFDVIPNDGIISVDKYGDIIDLDNMPELYAEGNPNFDVSDDLTIYSEYVPVDMFDASKSANISYYGNFFQTGYDATYGTFLTTTDDNGLWAVDDDVNTTATGYLEPRCAPILELWLNTPVELAGLCEDELIVELADCEGNNYFTLTVVDEDHTDYRIDSSIEVSRDVLDSTDVVRTYVDLDSTMLVKLDENIDATLKESYNLILIGGPVANTIVADLVDLGETTMEMWETSEGDVVMLEDIFAVGKDVLIVAGADRDMTAAAAIALIDAL